MQITMKSTFLANIYYIEVLYMYIYKIKIKLKLQIDSKYIAI